MDIRTNPKHYDKVKAALDMSRKVQAGTGRPQHRSRR